MYAPARVENTKAWTALVNTPKAITGKGTNKGTSKHKTPFCAFGSGTIGSIIFNCICMISPEEILEGWLISSKMHPKEKKIKNGIILLIEKSLYLRRVLFVKSSYYCGRSYVSI